MAYLNGNKVFLYGERTVDANLTTKTIKQNGTYNASSDNADGYSSVTVSVTPDVDYFDDKYFCRVLNYDGTVLAMEYLNNGDEFILPDFPDDDTVNFERWCGSQAISSRTVNGKTQYYITIDGLDFMAAPIVVTKDGTLKIGIKLDIITELTICFYLSASQTVNINWGDGNSETTTGQKIAHTYQSYGEYEISIDNANNFYTNNGLCQNLTTSLAVGTPWEGQTAQQVYAGNKRRSRIVQYLKTGGNRNSAVSDIVYNQMFIKYIALSIDSYNKFVNFSGFSYPVELGILRGGIELNIIPYKNDNVIPNGVSSVNKFIGKNVIIENGYTQLDGESHFRNAEYFVIPKTVRKISSNYILQVCNYKPNTLRLYAEECLAIYGIICKYLYYGDSVKKLSVGRNIHADKIRFPNSYTAIDSASYNLNSVLMFQIVGDSNGRLVLPSTLTTISRSLGRVDNKLQYLEFPSTITSTIGNIIEGSINIVKFKNLTNIVASSFNGVQRMVLDLTECQSIPTLVNTNAFYSLATGSYNNYYVFILVPSSLYNQWKTETNWSTYAQYIIPVDLT